MFKSETKKNDTTQIEIISRRLVTECEQSCHEEYSQYVGGGGAPTPPVRARVKQHTG